MVIIKQSVGIDISKDTFEVTFKEKNEKGISIKGVKKFEMSATGFSHFLEWCSKRERSENIIYVMEATGIYHEDLLYFLYQNGKHVSVELPQRIKHYTKSKGVKTKNDKIDSGIIADFGLERELRMWQAPSPEFKLLRDLSREHNHITQSKVASQNRLHAARYAHEKIPKLLELMQEQLNFYAQMLEAIEIEIKKVVKEDTKLNAKVEKISSIKGIGVLTVVKILAETGGFYLFNNINQLISYAGLDVIEDQSGKHIGKTRISKKGNSNLRTALYMPALSAIRYCEKMKEFNERLMETHSYKKQGIVAVMRKLLILVYTLWKKDEEYNPNYVWGKVD